MKIFRTFLIISLFISCVNRQNRAESDVNGSKPIPEKNRIDDKFSRHLNINVLLDLSNRIDSSKNPLNPPQIERDKAIIRNFVSFFKENVDRAGAFSAKSKIRVFFHPEPSNNEIASAAKKLNVSCKAGNRPEDAKRNKEIYKTIDDDFENGLNTIYSKALQQHDYPGANIWRFMKDDVKIQCIEDTNEYRNILVILTDGYLYYKNDLIREGNRYNYIERNFSHFTMFRKNNSISDEFDKGDYGLINANSDLNSLEVLVMEVAPDNSLPADYDIIKKYWEKWLSEMGVKHYQIVKTQQPVYLEKIISDFMKN